MNQLKVLNDLQDQKAKVVANEVKPHLGFERISHILVPKFMNWNKERKGDPSASFYLR